MAAQSRGLGGTKVWSELLNIPPCLVFYHSPLDPGRYMYRKQDGKDGRRPCDWGDPSELSVGEVGPWPLFHILTPFLRGRVFFYWLFLFSRLCVHLSMHSSPDGQAMVDGFPLDLTPQSIGSRQPLHCFHNSVLLYSLYSILLSTLALNCKVS